MRGKRFLVLVMVFMLAACHGRRGSSDVDLDVDNDGVVEDVSGDAVVSDTTTGDLGGDVVLPDGASCSSGQTQCSSDGTSLEECRNGQFITTTPCPWGCFDGACQMTAPPNACDTPNTLTLGTAVTGSTDAPGSYHSWTTECTSAYSTIRGIPAGLEPVGPEAVFSLNMPHIAPVLFELTPSTPTHFALYVRGDCADDTSQLHDVCSGTESIGTSVSIPTILAAGQHYVFVDDLATNGSGTGNFTLTATESLMVSCYDQMPELLDLSSGSATVNGDTRLGSSGSTWNASSSTNCAPFESLGSEVIYAFALRERTTLRIVASSVEPAQSRIALYVREVCDDRFAQVACGYSDGTGSNAELLNVFDPGAYYLFVDDFATSLDEAQSFTLALTVQ